MLKMFTLLFTLYFGSMGGGNFADNGNHWNGGNPVMDPPAIEQPADEQPETIIRNIPVILVHGWDVFDTGFSATYWSTTINFLEENGYDENMIMAKTMPIENGELCSFEHAKVIAQWIDEMLAKHPEVTQVDLVGHSRGGLNIMRAIWDEDLDLNKIRNVVTLAGYNRGCYLIPEDETPGNINYTSIYSTGDRMVRRNSAYLDGALMIEITGISHRDMVRDMLVLSEMLDALSQDNFE